MEQGRKRAPKPHHPHHPHHMPPGQPAGYTDEAAAECHDLIDRAEEDAHLHEPSSMYSTTDKPEPVHRATAPSASGTAGASGAGVGGGIRSGGDSAGSGKAKGQGGLEGAAGAVGGTAAAAGEKMQQTGQNVTEALGGKMGEVKKKMGLGE
ncbi:uncharacterized protein C8A04DRAFT_33299 [Dichotomopilus funicola]|uniref:Uncharacterized protein n=1 Tax=Dichotomopilus funicola TaxID=1934379 RepID=A0AAN6UUA8_9PEZI|nr:hypothetical protein C8A04DRAFT_33299 [Dichotomopilus funicola]